MKDNDILLLAVLMVISVVSFGAFYGIETSEGLISVPNTPETPGVLGTFSWAIRGLNFLWNLLNFEVVGIPIYVGLVFLVMGVMLYFVAIKVVRGSST